MSSTEIFFALLGVALALIPWALSELGIAVPRPIIILSLILGLCSLGGALGIPAYRRWLAPPTYVYLIAGRGLGENSANAPQEMIERRVFVLQQSGSGTLHDVDVMLHDDHAIDQTATDHIDHYPEVGPEESHTGAPPKHFWFKPATPWNEHYSVLINSHETVIHEQIIVRGIQAPNLPPLTNPPAPPKVWLGHGDSALEPEMGKVVIAIRVEDLNQRLLFTCADKELREQIGWSKNEPEACAYHSTDIPSFEANLDPKPFFLNFPSGGIDMTPNAYRTNPLSSYPEAEDDKRRLSE